MMELSLESKGVKIQQRGLKYGRGVQIHQVDFQILTPW